MKDNNAPMKDSAREWMKIIGGPSVLFFALPWLMILLILGTVAQKDMGLYAAQQMFFSSWILWWGPLPLPGAYLTLGVISICLLVKFLLYSPWRRHQAGIILTHLGVLILMIGGMLTALTQEEGYLALREGQSGQSVSSYHGRVLTVEKDGAVFAHIPYESLHRGESLALPFPATIKSLCRNCRPVPAKEDENRRGLATEMQLREGAAEKEDEANLSGLTLSLSGLSDEQDGLYILMEEVPHKPTVTYQESEYRFSLGRAQEALPFSIELVDFRRDLHPGTDTAREFSSAIIVRDGDIAWPYTIRMNEPLRYKGYTFYQASFSIRPDGEYSVLSVVRNQGRVFPYIASAMIFAGLLLHIVLRLRERKRAAA